MIAPATMWVKSKIHMEKMVLLLPMEEINTILALLIAWFIAEILNTKMVHALLPIIPRKLKGKLVLSSESSELN